MAGRYFRDYLASRGIASDFHKHLMGGDEFYSLLMAAARFADTRNTQRLEEAFPDLMAELKARYNAPGGALDDVELDFVRSLYERDNEVLVEE